MFKDSNLFRVIMSISSTGAWIFLQIILLTSTFKSKWSDITFSSQGENVSKTSHLEITQNKKQFEAHRQCVVGWHLPGLLLLVQDHSADQIRNRSLN